MSCKPKVIMTCEICKNNFSVIPSLSFGKKQRKVCGLKCSGILTSRRPKILGRKMSEEAKKKMSITRKGQPAWNKGLKGYHAGEKHHWFGRNMSGENNPTYIKDRTLLKRFNDDAKDRRSSAYFAWRKEVWLRDNFTCKIANPDCKGRIEAHHILGWASHPELRFNINNGITLCRFHHPRKREEEKRLIPTFEEIVASMSVSKE